MPAPAVVLGVEFQAVSVSNGVGTLTLFVTVFNAAGEFQIRVVQTGAPSGSLLIQRTGGAITEYPLPNGNRVALRRQDSVQLGMSWTQVAAKFTVIGTRT